MIDCQFPPARCHSPLANLLSKSSMLTSAMGLRSITAPYLLAACARSVMPLETDPFQEHRKVRGECDGHRSFPQTCYTNNTLWSKLVFHASSAEYRRCLSCFRRKERMTDLTKF